jgi:hypothetical protein
MPVFVSAMNLKEEIILSDEDKKDKFSFNIIIDPLVAEDHTKIYVNRFVGGSSEDWLQYSSQNNKVFQAKGWKQQPTQYCPIHKGLTQSLKKCKANPGRTTSEGQSSGSGDKVAEQHAVVPCSASMTMQRKKRIFKQDEVNFIESLNGKEATEEEDQDEYFSIENLTPTYI